MSMNAEQFREAIEALGLTQTGVNGVDRFLGVNETTVRRWAREAGPPDAVAMLLRLMVYHGWKSDWVRDRYAEDRPRAKGAG
jgi:hypothetical protein